MRTFKVTTSHNVFIDDYENGEGKQVNFYQQTSEQNAESVKTAIENHFKNVIYLPFNFNETDTNEDKTVMYWNALVDENNEQPHEGDIERWKKGTRDLYSNNIDIEVKELINVTF
jgi:hypothetical protein